MSGSLFAGRDLPDEKNERLRQALHQVAQASVDELLSRDLDVLVDEYLHPFQPATVLWDHVTMTEPSPHSSSGARDVFGRPFTQHGATSTLRVPVDGDAMLLTYRSHRGAPLYSTTTGRVKPGLLEFEWTGSLDVSPEAIEEWLTQRKVHVEQFLSNNNLDVPSLNDEMRSSIRRAIEDRRERELKRRQLAASLPFPVERKPGATVPIRVERKKVRLQQRPAPAPFKPEPELEQATYEAILEDCVSVATIFERMPIPPDSDEEHIRNFILGMLNTNYTGQVAGEVFNGSGKTDVLIREENRNVFIGECKFYRGPQSVIEAVDQVLSYMPWRDTKAALLLFYRGGNFTKLVDSAVDAVGGHPQCQRRLTAKEPTRRTDFIFNRADDPDRAIHLAVLPFRLQK